jgi:hypothetical protein
LTIDDPAKNAAAGGFFPPRRPANFETGFCFYFESSRVAKTDFSVRE